MELNTNGDGKSLAFNEWGFQILLFTAPVRIPKILMFFPVGMRVQCSFPMGINFQSIFLTGDDNLADFSSG